MEASTMTTIRPTIRPNVGDYVVVLGRDRRHVVRRVIEVKTSTFAWQKSGDYGLTSTGISHVLFAGDQDTAHSLAHHFDESRDQCDKAIAELRDAQKRRDRAAIAAVTRKI
jgi:hypothetical protein